MPSQSEKNKALEASRKEELASARAEVDQDRAEFLRDKTAPLVREDEHSYVEPAFASTDPEVVQPDLTDAGASMANLEANQREDSRVEVKTGDGSDTSLIPTAEAVELLSDEQIKKSGLLDASEDRFATVHAARLAPSSERPRTPLQRAPAAGPGTWPVPEDALPAAMPSDPPKDERTPAGDVSLASLSGFSTTTEGELEVKRARSGTTVKVPKKLVAAAANLWLSLRQQFPHTPHDELRDEFTVQLEGMIGMPQSDKPASEVSQVDVTAVGDPRVSPSHLGADRQEATDDTASFEQRVDELVKTNNEKQLRELAGDNSEVKADSDKRDIARAILRAQGGTPPASGPKAQGADNAKP